MMRRLLTTAITAALAVGPAVMAPTDDSFENPPPGVPGHREQIGLGYIEYLGSREGVVNTSEYLGKCGVQSPGQRCTITVNTTITHEVSAQYGATEQGLTATIGVSVSEAKTIGETCLSPELKPGEVHIAYPYETRYYYRVTEDVGGYFTPEGEYISGTVTTSPDTYTAVYEKGMSCAVLPRSG